MLYAILIYGSEDHYAALSAAQETELMQRHAALRQELAADERLGPVMRLKANGGRTVRRYKDRAFITDGPYAETKEQLMGIYVIDCASFQEAVDATAQLDFETGVFEIRPLDTFEPGQIPARL
jgi:hypothetical protein